MWLAIGYVVIGLLVALVVAGDEEIHYGVLRKGKDDRARAVLSGLLRERFGH